MLWADVELFIDAKKSLMYSRFMHILGFAGFLHMPKFLISACNICQTPELCVKNWKRAETHISDNDYMTYWLEPEPENQIIHKTCV